MGDDQRLRHRGPSRHDRDPRLDARPRQQDARSSRCASRSSTASDGKWRNARRSADSGWQTVGRTIRQVIESGQNFTFLPPTDGGSHELRGAVRFRWIRAGKTRRYQQRFTEPGHTSTAGADPKNYSAGLCEIA